MKASKLIAVSLLAVLGGLPATYALASNSSDGTEETIGEHIDDSVITSKVKAAFLNEDNLKSLGIHVKTIRGVVYLSGHIHSSANRKTALAVARSIEGVKSVKDNMHLK